MNVLAITSSYPRFEGDPTAPFVESIVRGLAARGHTVHLLLPESSEWCQPASDGSIRFHPYRYSPRRSWTPWGYSESLARGTTIRKPLYALAPVVAASALREASRVLSRNPVEVVHAHWVIPNGPIGAVVARRHHLPLVVSLHGSDVAVAERSNTIGRAARWTLARTAAVTAPSGDLLERALELGASGLIERIPYGADVEDDATAIADAGAIRKRLDMGPEHVVVAGIGRLIAVKGFDYLLDALARSSTARPELRLIIVGDGDERRGLEYLAARLGIAERVVFTGMADRCEIPSYLAAADIVALPSVHHEGYVDGLPNVALEAMAAGKPLVASRVGGLPEVVRHGENGLLVEEKDSGALAEAIETLASDAELRARMGEAGRALIRNEMSWERVAERFEAVYERVTASG